MHLIQLLLPLYDNRDQAFAGRLYREVGEALVARFGGLTAFTRAPATGLWQEDGVHTERDEVVVYEVMAETLDRDWWAAYRARLEQRFGQEELVIRAWPIERL
ncbi:hypothetical protein HKW98_04740 [Stutzerimonas urumqiensis]|uniref:hypothetical protein n=1 Tax=Stutzerimonas urumqiensis TaxID=638269 RepID=UPI000EAC247F|nr:hypothetical protein [Stutzerimonas urumqiensis]